MVRLRTSATGVKCQSSTGSWVSSERNAGEREVSCWVQRTQPYQFSDVTGPPELLYLAYAFPDTADKFFSLPGYFQVCQNGAWKWSVSMELALHFDLKSTQGSGLVGGAAQADLLFQRKCAAVGVSVP